MSGLTDAGLDLDSYDDLVTAMSADWVARTGVSADAVAEDAGDGILIRIVAERIAATNDLTQAVFSALDRDAATGAQLVSLATLTGTIQESARKSTASLLLVGTALTVIPVGSRSGSATSTTLWDTTAAATLAAATAWAVLTAYVLRDVRTNAGKVYRCITAGTSAAAGGPTTTAASITDGTVAWAYVGDGAAIATAPAAATITGPLSGVAYSISQIKTPVSGWSGVVNLLDAVLGADLESDSALRARSADELEAQGVSVADAIRAELLDVALVTSVTVFINDTDDTDDDGVPPHSFEALVQDGANQDIFDRLLASKPDGIRAYGSTSGTATDSEGNVIAVSFSRPTLIPIYGEITVEVDATTFPVDGATQVKAAIVAFGAKFPCGRDARARSLGGVTIARTDANGNQLGVAGVLDFTSMKIKTSPGPTLEATIVISRRQRATFDTGNLTVVVVNVTP